MGAPTSQGRDAVRPAGLRSAGGSDPYLPRGLLRCGGCDQPVEPVQVLGRPRRYACGLGCRMTPLLATDLETRVWLETCRRAPRLASGCPRAARAAVIGQVFCAITVGGTAADLSFRVRTQAPGGGAW